MVSDDKSMTGNMDLTRVDQGFTLLRHAKEASIGRRMERPLP
jgi:hypothetical protein